MSRVLKIALVCASLLVSFAVSAKTGPYISGGVGYGTIEGSDIDGGDKGRPAVNVGLGYQFNDVFALQGNLQYYSDATASESYYDFKTNAVVGSVLGVLRAPVSDKVHLVVKAGPGYSNLHGEFNGRRYDYSIDDNGFSLSYGAGIEIAFNDRVSFLAEYLGSTVYLNSDYDEEYHVQLNSVMGNLIYRF